VGIRELQRGGGQRHVVLATYRFEPAHAFNYFLGRGSIVELQVPLHATRQDARVKCAAQQDTYAPRFARRQQVVERGLLQQCIAACQQRAVNVEIGHHLENRRPFVNP